MNTQKISLWIISLLFLSSCTLYYKITGNDKYLQPITVTQGDSIIKSYVLPQEKDVGTSSDVTYHWYRPNNLYTNKGGYSGNLLHGPFLILDRNKNLLVKGAMRKGQKSKEWKYWYKDGELKTIAHWKNGKLNGTFKSFNRNSKLDTLLNYNDGVKHGKLRYYDKNGNVIVKGSYKKGKKHGEFTYMVADSAQTEYYINGQKRDKDQHRCFIIRWIKHLFNSGNDSIKTPKNSSD